MNQIPMNDGIITYVEFTEKIFNHKEVSPSQSEYENFISIYNQFKENGKIKKSLQNINAQNKQILGFNYEKIEHVWAYIHLMIEHIEKNEINILQEGSSFQNLKYLQDGLSRIWLSNPIEGAKYIDLTVLKKE